MRARISKLMLTAGVFLGCVAIAMPPLASAQSAVSAEVGATLEAAVAAVRRKQFDAALAKVKEAQAKKQSAYDQFKIDEILLSIYSGQGKYAEQAAAYERLLASSQYLSEAQRRSYPKLAIQSYVHAGQHGKVIELGARWLEDQPDDVQMLTWVGRAYYGAKNYKLCQKTFASAVAIAEKSNGRPAEDSLDIARYCADEAGDTAAETWAYEKLVRYHPNADRWYEYLRRASSEDRDDVATYNWLRLMHDTGALRRAADYMEYGERAISEFGTPCEAQRVLEDGFSKKVLGIDAKLTAREEKRLRIAKEAVQSDATKISALAAEAEKDATGQRQIELGMIHFGCARYGEAIAALTKGLNKGGLTDAAHARLVLGIAQLRSGKRDEARATFKQLSSDKRLGKVASAWILRSYS